MINEKDNLKRIKEKVIFFMNEKINVHVKRTDLKFFNGYFVEEKTKGVYVFKDRVLGLIHIFLSDIFEVNEYRVRE